MEGVVTGGNTWVWVFISELASLNLSVCLSLSHTHPTLGTHGSHSLPLIPEFTHWLHLDPGK